MHSAIVAGPALDARPSFRCVSLQHNGHSGARALTSEPGIPTLRSTGPNRIEIPGRREERARPEMTVRKLRALWNDAACNAAAFGGDRPNVSGSMPGNMSAGKWSVP